MPELMLIQGKPELITDDEDFARMLRNRLGEDAEQWFRCVLEKIPFDPDDDIYARCEGECDKLFEQQEHYQRVLEDIQSELCAWPVNRLTRAQIDERRDRLLKQIDSEL